MAQQPAQGLALADNLLLNNMTQSTWQKDVIAADWGFNKVSNIMNMLNKNGSVGIDNFKQLVPVIGKIGISNTVNGASTLSGSKLIVTMQNVDTRWRVKDLVGDRNHVQGRIIQVISSTQLLLEPHNITSWNTGTHFTNGMNMTNFGDVSGNGVTTGKTSLSYSPAFDEALVGTTRETYQEGKKDRINSRVLYKNGLWYTAQQQYALTNFSRMKELRIVWSDKVEKASSSVEGDYNTPGGIRWSAKNNGGTYMSINSALNRSILQEFIYTMANKFAGNGAQKKLLFLVGRDAMAQIQSFTEPAIQYTGINNTFGGGKVDGFDTRTYSWAGITFDMQLYDGFNDNATWGNQTSSITGRNPIASTIMALDLSPAPSANGGDPIPVLRPYHYNGLGAEMLFSFIPGMGGSQTGKMTAMPGNSIDGNNYTLATSSLDACSWELETCDGFYVIPEKVGWLELIG